MKQIQYRYIAANKFVDQDEFDFVGGISELRPKRHRFLLQPFLFVGLSMYLLLLLQLIPA